MFVFGTGLGIATKRPSTKNSAAPIPTHLVTLFYFPRFFERDFLFGVLYGLHNVFVRAYLYPALFGIKFKLYVHCLAEILFAGKRQCVFERGNKNALIDSLFPFKVIKCRKKILVNHFPCPPTKI